eukprot:TRINITY_DN653_c0_g1_i1.p1 TRINITY_DN653_c0_g1~~TRINITY_DN653_c0_g1_i1.p1  ORF type:complete len:443 (+),score=100.77 TRINITY_DN653_c0_g1_i1:87-1415(+)
MVNSRGPQQDMGLAKRKRVTIIGGGAVGVSCGYYMQRAGHEVTIVERGDIGKKGATYGNAGVIADFERLAMNQPSLPRQLWGMMSWNDGPMSFALTRHFFTHTTSFGLRFLAACLPGQAERSSHGLAEINKRAGAAWKEILADLPEEHSDVLTSCPVMHACDEDHWGGLSSATKVRRARGSALTVCENRQELAAHEPAFADEKNFPTVRAGVMYDSMYIRNPSRLVGLVCTELFQKKYGGTLVRGSVVDVRGTDVVVETGDSQKEVIRSDVVVLACGAQGLNLLPKIGEDTAPLDTERGYSIAFTGEAARSLQTSIGWTPLKFFFTPMEHGLRVAGISELGGLGPATPEHYDWLERKARMLLPSLPPRDKKHDWIGYRPSLPDMLPVISWSDRNPDIFHCYGHGHFGLTQAAVTGKLAETMVSGSEPHFDPTPYRIDRFRLW